MITVTKKDLIALGYGTSFSADIIRKAKKLMIEKGHTITNPVNWTEYPKKPWKNYQGLHYQTQTIDCTSCILCKE